MANLRQFPQTYALTIVTDQRRRILKPTATPNSSSPPSSAIVTPDASNSTLSSSCPTTFTPLSPLPWITPPHAAFNSSRAVPPTPSANQPREESGKRAITNTASATPRDYNNQVLYIANNPTRKDLTAYPHIHTDPRYKNLIDPTPAHIAAPSVASRYADALARQ